MLERFLLLSQIGLGGFDVLLVLLETLGKLALALVVEGHPVFRSRDGILFVGKPLPQSGKLGVENLGLVTGLHHRRFELRQILLDGVATLEKGGKGNQQLRPFAGEAFPEAMTEVRVEDGDILGEGLVTAGLGDLALQRIHTPFLLGEHIGYTQKVAFSIF